MIDNVNALSAGIFLAAGLIHLMPEASFLYHGNDLAKEPYPVPFLVMVISYFIILLIEKVMFNPHELFGEDN